MAIKKFRFRPEGVNDYSDILHPETSADVVLLEDTAGNFSSNNVEGALTELFTLCNGKQDALGYTPVNKSGDEMTGILTAYSNTSYTVRQVRNIILSTADADVDAMQDGDIWIKYK